MAPAQTPGPGRPQPPTIGRLRSGGIMANYRCSSACRHCAYFCGPRWSNDYIDEAGARRALIAIKRGGCSSVHIGGGEPFLDQAGLKVLLECCREEGVAVEYVESNCSWYRGHDEAVDLLRELRAAGLETLLISMDPFHNEFIPWRRVTGALAACEEAGMGVFPWTPELGRDVAQLDPEKRHTLEEYEEHFGPGYLESIPRRHWISDRGRAVATFRPLKAALTANEAAAAAGSACSELFDTSHFHVDLYGNYVPGVCSGLAIDLDDLDGPLDREKYRFLTAIMDGGLTRLLDIARDEYGFTPRESYSGKCDLCYDIRSHLVHSEPGARDLAPAELYLQMGDE